MKEGWYCSNSVGNNKCFSCIISHPDATKVYGSDQKNPCKNAHRKHPTPEQFREEYGREYPEDWAVYRSVGENPFRIDSYRNALHEKSCMGDTRFRVVCASTPFGKPPDDFEVTE